MKLSDFPGDKGFEIAAKAMPLIMQIRRNPETVKAWDKLMADQQKRKERESAIKDSKKAKEEAEKSSKAFEMQIYQFYSSMLMNERDASIELFALLNDTDKETFVKNRSAAAMIMDIVNAFAYDNELMSLFGLRAQERTSTSGSASENTEE